MAHGLGGLGLYRQLLPELFGGAPCGHADDPTKIDVRSLVVVREALGQVSPLADAIFAVQGLGSYPVAAFGSREQRDALLPSALSGERIFGFALTEPEAGSDVASMRTTATRQDDGSWLLDGHKTLISNVGIAHHYVLFANADPSAGKRGISAFVLPKGTAGLEERAQALSSPHPLGELHLSRCRLPSTSLLGEVGQGLRIALSTLDTFRISVGAAANGMASRALALAIERVKARRQFGGPLSDQQQIQAYLADMATDLDAARLLVARAAHGKDCSETKSPTDAAMAKMFATESAQRVIDRAVQLFGGSGVLLGSEVEALYRDIRPLRIYEGTTEIQRVIIARALLSA